MRELLRDPDTMNAVRRRRVLRSLIPAVGKLTRVARGRDSFRNEHQLRACITLARLAILLAADPKAGVRSCLDDPEWWTPEKELGMKRLEWLETLSPEQSAQREVEWEAAYDEWRNSRPRSFKSAAEAAEYFRAHPVISFSEIEEEMWPDHLKRSTFDRGENHDDRAARDRKVFCGRG
jgi:hypothetical protein